VRVLCYEDQRYATRRDIREYLVLIDYLKSIVSMRGSILTGRTGPQGMFSRIASSRIAQELFKLGWGI
jgi:hypothetical protein